MTTDPEELEDIPRLPEYLKEPLSLHLWKQLVPKIHKYAFGLDILGADVVYGHVHQVMTTQQAYILQVTCRGALLGTQYYLCGQVPMGGAHLPDLTDAEITGILLAVCNDLRKAKAEQASPNSQGHKP
jgi:hypothetical protein